MQKEGDLIITSNGKPVAILSGIGDNNLEEHLKALCHARATLAINRIQERSRREGLDKISEAEMKQKFRPSNGAGRDENSFGY